MLMKLKLSATLCVAVTTAFADSYDVLLKRYERQIVQQERQLKSLRSRLLEKERDAQRWQDRAQHAKANWNDATREAEEMKEKVRGVQERYRKTRTLADAAEWSVAERTLVSNAADAQLRYWARQQY